MSSPRWRPARLALAAVLVVVLVAACSAAAAQRAHKGSRSVTVRGPLVRMRGATLIVKHEPGQGTVRVMFAPLATAIYAVTAASPAAIQPGSCVATAGGRDATGTVAARIIVVASSVDDACPAASVPAPPRPVDPTPSPAPTPGSFPLPSPYPGRADVLRGQVLSVGAGAIVVQGPQGEPVVVVLPPNDRVLWFQPGNRSSLVIPSCVVIQGTQVLHAVAARQIVDWPSGTVC